MPQVIGRPKHLYGQNVQQFEAGWQKIGGKTPKRTEVEPGFGWFAYVTKGEQHLFRLHITPSSNTSKFFWVFLEGAETKAHDFGIPVPLSLYAVDELVRVWSADFDVTWVDGTMHSKTFPKHFSMPKAFIHSKSEFLVLMRDARNESMFFLERRKGVHTLPRDQFAGIVCPVNQLRFLAPFFSEKDELAPSVLFPDLQTVVEPKALTKLRKCGAEWARAKFLTKRGDAMWPFLPHAPLVDVPAHAITPLEV